MAEVAVKLTARNAYETYNSGLPNAKTMIEGAIKSGQVTKQYVDPANPKSMPKGAYLIFLQKNNLITNTPNARTGGFGSGANSTFIDGDKELAPVKAKIVALQHEFDAICERRKLNLGLQLAFKLNDTTKNIDGSPRPVAPAAPAA